MCCVEVLLPRQTSPSAASTHNNFLTAFVITFLFCNLPLSLSFLFLPPASLISKCFWRQIPLTLDSTPSYFHASWPTAARQREQLSALCRKQTPAARSLVDGYAAGVEWVLRRVKTLWLPFMIRIMDAKRFFLVFSTQRRCCFLEYLIYFVFVFSFTLCWLPAWLAAENLFIDDWVQGSTDIEFSHYTSLYLPLSQSLTHTYTYKGKRFICRSLGALHIRE